MTEEILTGPRLREMRRRRGWSQRELATRARVSVTAVRHWEAGRRPVSPSMALLIRMLFTPTATGGTTA